MVNVRSDDSIRVDSNWQGARPASRSPLFSTGVLISVRSATSRIAILGALFASLAMVSVARSQEASARRDQATEQGQIGGKGIEPQPDGRLTPRQRAVLVGAVLLALVLILSVALVAFIIVLGQRTRRLASKPLPEGAQRDELWYLRQNRSSLDDSGPPSDKTSDDARNGTQPE